MNQKMEETLKKINNIIDEFVEYVGDMLRQRAQESLRLLVRDASQFEEELKDKKIRMQNIDLRSECITFLRDFGIKESYKGTEYLIYTLLTYRSSDNVKLNYLYKEIASVYNISDTTIRSSLIGVLKSVDDEYITAKESLFVIMRDWEIYKQDKGLE